MSVSRHFHSTIPEGTTLRDGDRFDWFGRQYHADNLCGAWTISSDTGRRRLDPVSSAEELTSIVRKLQTLKAGQLWAAHDGTLFRISHIDHGDPACPARCEERGWIGVWRLDRLLAEDGEVPALEVGQVWQTLGGKEVIIQRHGNEFIARNTDNLRVGPCWWYQSHTKNKSAHSPGAFKDNEHRDALAKLISLPKAEERVTATEVRAAKPTATPEKPRIQVGQMIRYLGPALPGVVVSVDPLRVRYSCDDRPRGQILTDHAEVQWPWEQTWTRVTPKESRFKVGEVWAGKKGHLIRIDAVDANDGKLTISIIHSPPGEHQYTPEPGGHSWRLDAEGLYNGSTNDLLSLVRKV